MPIGDEVRIKDKVHVLHHRGYAVVESRTPDDGGFNVNLSGQGTVHFNRDRCPGASDRRMVYWHDPLLFDPPKDPVLWNAFKAMAGQLYETLASWRKEGWGEGSDGGS